MTISSLPYYSKLLFDMDYIEVLAEYGFNEDGEPLKGCKNIDLLDDDKEVEKLEQLALDRFYKKQAEVEPFDFD